MKLIVDALCSNIGRDLTKVHVGLNITDDQWGTFMGIITSALMERNVAADVQRDIVALFESELRPTVVVQ